ncbi:MAG: hypothetical protein ABIH74_04950, partial [Candidatus Omnitrophota bacterium]
MMRGEQTLKIYGAFCDYVKTKNKRLIKDFTAEDIEFALIECSIDEREPPYKAMKRQLGELKKREEKKNVRPNGLAKNSEDGECKYVEGTCWLKIEEEYEISKKKFGMEINFVKGAHKRKIIFRDVEQAYILSKRGFNKPALILAGSIIEELLRLYLESKDVPLKDD